MPPDASQRLHSSLLSAGRASQHQCIAQNEDGNLLRPAETHDRL